MSCEWGEVELDGVPLGVTVGKERRGNEGCAWGPSCGHGEGQGGKGEGTGLDGAGSGRRGRWVAVHLAYHADAGGCLPERPRLNASTFQLVLSCASSSHLHKSMSCCLR